LCVVGWAQGDLCSPGVALPSGDAAFLVCSQMLHPAPPVLGCNEGREAKAFSYSLVLAPPGVLPSKPPSLLLFPSEKPTSEMYFPLKMQ